MHKKKKKKKKGRTLNLFSLPFEHFLIELIKTLNDKS